MNRAIHQPHDTIFKAAFSHKQVMVDFLRSRLPQETLARIDLSTLKLTNKSFVSKTGRQTHSDLIYSSRMDKQQGYIYLVTEHFSEQEKYVPLRQIEYNLPLMRQHLNEGHKKLPLILNICVHNCTNPYQGPITFLEMFEHPGLAKQFFLEGYHMVDLSVETEANIHKDKQAALAELLLKQGKLRDFHHWIDKHQDLLNDNSIPYAEEGFHYILTVDPRNDTLEKLQKNAEPQTKEKIMNAAEKLIQQGKQQGIQQGIQQGKQQGIQQGKQQGIQQGMKTRSLEIAKNMLLNLHLGMDVVQKATGLSSKELKKLQVSE